MKFLLIFLLFFGGEQERNLWATTEELTGTTRIDPDCSVQLTGPLIGPQFMIYPKVPSGPVCTPYWNNNTWRGHNPDTPAGMARRLLEADSLHAVA